MKKTIKKTIDNMFKDIFKDKPNIDDSVEILNYIKTQIKKVSPFSGEPVDTVIWVKSENVIANDYNPNVVAPPEMLLLEHSVKENGYTQPIVAWINDDKYEVVDGFHRNRVGRESEDIRNRIHGYLPITVINDDSIDRGNRIVATVRHNRARGKHTIDGMAEIILDLKRRNWSESKISKNLGMDADEVLRLSQITGLAEMFSDREFSEAWEVDKIDEDDNLDEIENE